MTITQTRRVASRSWLPTGLVVSLGLNLLLGGLVMQGQLLPRLGGRPLLSAEQAFQGMASRLPAPDSAILSGALAQARPELHRLVDEQRITHDQIKATLTAASLDTVALERQIQASRDQRHAITSLLATTLQRALEAMSPDGRAAFARNYESGHRG